LDGTTGDDRFILTDPNTINIQGLQFKNFETIQGGGGNNTLEGSSSNNSFVITENNTGTIAAYSFSAIQNLVGGSGDDTFTFSDGGTLSGTLDGQAGNNTIVTDDVANTVIINAENSGTITNVGNGFRNLQNIFTQAQDDVFRFENNGSLSGTIAAAGGNNLLIASDEGMSFIVTGENTGLISDRLGEFTSIQNLSGGLGDDSFTLNEGIFLAGNLFTGEGSDVINLGLNATIGGGLSGNSEISVQGAEINLANLLGSRPLDTPGGLNLSTAGNIIAADIRSGGSIQFNAVGNITTGNLTAPGQAIFLTSNTSEITTGNINTSAATGGTVFLNALLAITTGTIDSSGTVGSGGNVTLDPIGDVEVGSINAQGGADGVGGNVDVTAGQFFRATDSFTDQNGTNASVSTAGGLGGGAITINHGGGALNTPFKVGDPAVNGSLGEITDGTTSFGTNATFFGPVQIDNLGIITTDTNPPSNPEITDPISGLGLEDVLQSSDDEIIAIELPDLRKNRDGILVFKRPDDPDFITRIREEIPEPEIPEPPAFIPNLREEIPNPEVEENLREIYPDRTILIPRFEPDRISNFDRRADIVTRATTRENTSVSGQKATQSNKTDTAKKSDTKPSNTPDNRTNNSTGSSDIAAADAEVGTDSTLANNFPGQTIAAIVAALAAVGATIALAKAGAGSAITKAAASLLQTNTPQSTGNTDVSQTQTNQQNLQQFNSLDLNMGTKMNITQALSSIKTPGSITQDLEISMRGKSRITQGKIEIKTPGSVLVQRSGNNAA
jgi:hypothetical protein